MADKINLNVTQLDEKLSILSQIKTDIEDNISISSLPFGSTAIPDSRGLSSAQMNQVNQDFSLCADKFSLLVGATIKYLENVKSTFLEADAQLAGGA